jgi:hypothetical protein
MINVREGKTRRNAVTFNKKSIRSDVIKFFIR